MTNVVDLTCPGIGSSDPSRIVGKKSTVSSFAFVFSGVNHGPNMGEDVLYSGTVSVAMEAVTLGIPGIAFSFASREVDIMASYATLLAGLVRRIVEVRTFPKNMILNVNLPGIDANEVRGVRVTKVQLPEVSGSASDRRVGGSSQGY